jgi:ATP-dependent helicase/DNAse subunit B
MKLRDRKKKEIDIYELSYVLQTTIDETKKFVTGEGSRMVTLRRALELEKILRSYGYDIPAEVFLLKEQRRVLKEYVESLTESTFTIRELNLMTGEHNEHNRIREKDKNLWKHITSILKPFRLIRLR